MSYYFPTTKKYSDNLTGENENVLVNYNQSGAFPVQPNNKISYDKFVLYSNENGSKLFDMLHGQRLISPIGIFYMLLLIANGCTGNTMKEIVNSLMISDILSLNNDLINLKKMDEIKISNKIFIKNGYKINDNYMNFIKNFGDIRNIDFNSDEMKKQTTIIIQNSMNKIVLINTTYFKSNWAKKFNPSKESSFYFNNTIIKLPIMSKKDTVRYNEDNASQMIEIDYKNTDYCMGVLLPKNKYQKPSITIDIINDRIGRMDIEMVEIHLPKFKQHVRINLIEGLKYLGINDLFSPKAMLTKINDKNELFVSEMIHEALVIVDEYGESTVTSSKSQNIIFRADHPFIYYIRYRPNNLILFMGQYEGNN